MNLLLDFLKTRRSVRWLAHLLGILAGAGLLGFVGESWGLAGEKAGAATRISRAAAMGLIIKKPFGANELR